MYNHPLSAIVAQHPTELAQLFAEYGINAPVTPETLTEAIVLYKDDFIKSISRLSSPCTCHSASFEGEESGGFEELLKDTINTVKGFPVFQSLKQLYNEAKSTIHAAEGDSKENALFNAPWNLPNVLILGGIILLIILVLFKRS